MSTSRKETDSGTKAGDTLTLSLSSFIPLKCIELKSAMEELYPKASKEQFHDLHTLLETMCNFKHLSVKQRMFQGFWQCAGSDIKTQASQATTGKEEVAFMEDFHQLMSKANFQLLTEEEYGRSVGDGFILDIRTLVNTKNMDGDFFRNFLDAHPQLRQNYKTFDDKMLVYHRGVGLSVKEGRFISEKVELLKDMVVIKPVMFILGLLLFRRKKADDGKKTDAYTDDSPAKEGSQTKKYERRTLRRVYTNFFSLLFRLFSLVHLSEPTYREVVIIYRVKPKPKYNKDKAADRLAMIAASAAGESSDKDDQVKVKSFVDVPMADLNLCFPDTDVQVPMFETLMTVFLILASVASVVMQLLSSSWNSAQLTVTAMVGMRIMTKVDKLTNLKKTLGFKKSLALYDKARNSQEGVMTHTTEMMVEQETMQMLLAYTLLLTKFGKTGANNQQLDEACEDHLRKMFDVDVDFNVDYGLEKLTEYGLIVQRGERTFAKPLSEGLSILDKEWDEFFEYSTDFHESGDASTSASLKTSSSNAEPASSNEVAVLKAQHAVEVRKLKAQQSLLCRKVKELEVAMSEL